ncbi:MAG: DUF4360 domain-containing protein [Pseudobdellovibrionaceae bacterium]
MKMQSIVLSLAILMGATSAYAQQGLKLGAPAYGGTGCPAGTASLNLSPSETELSILFDSFVAEAGGFTGVRVSRKSCNLSIPVEVPQGYSVAVIRVDYRGYNLVPSGGRNQIAAEYFWAGSQGPRLAQSFVGPRNDDYMFTNNLIAQTTVWTPCGASVNMRVNASVTSQTNSRMDQSMMTVDSTDISTGLVYHLQWRRCF